jgi:hypothetical protein
VRRYVGGIQNDDIISVLKESENRVKISLENEIITYWIGGNANLTRTFLHLPDVGSTYEIHIPGYSDYAGGIFQLHPDQWRDQLLFDGNWRTIQSVVIEIPESNQTVLNLRFENDFFTIEGIDELDSNKVVAYLDQFVDFRVNEWISRGRFEKYDSLGSSSPLAKVTIDAISIEEPLRILIFPIIANEGYHLAIDATGDMMLIDQRRINQILTGANNFKYSSSR